MSLLSVSMPGGLLQRPVTLDPRSERRCLTGVSLVCRPALRQRARRSGG